MAIETISYSLRGQGWDSFHSFIPEWLERLNNSMYSWNGGNLYLHDSNETRNNYYGQSYPSEISPIINAAPSDNKVFETILIEGNKPWSCTMTTDMNEGLIESDFFVEKEGDFFAYIRRPEGEVDTKSLYINGIGEVDSYVVLTVSTGEMIMPISDFGYAAEGDYIYRDNAGVNLLIGRISSIVGGSIFLDSVQNAPSAGQFVFLVKNSVSESDGLRGSFMQIDMSIESDTEVEMFAVSSNVIKSYP